MRLNLFSCTFFNLGFHWPDNFVLVSENQTRAKLKLLPPVLEANG